MTNINPRFFRFLLLGVILTTHISCLSQSDSIFSERNYREVSRGVWSAYDAITYQNIYDTNRYIRKLYANNQYNDSMHFKYFFYKDIMDGPCEFYFLGKLASSGFMKNNKEHGKQIQYDPEGIITKISFYNEGIKTGIWKYYEYSGGKLNKKIFYDESGKFQKQEIYDRNGRLVRTEFKERQLY